MPCTAAAASEMTMTPMAAASLTGRLYDGSEVDAQGAGRADNFRQCRPGPARAF
jgi:hypothetical protein